MTITTTVATANRRTNAALLALFAVFVLSILVQGIANRYLPIFSQDAASTLLAARDIKHFLFHEVPNSNGIAYHGVGYPFLIAVLSKWFLSDVAAALLLNVVFGVAFLWVMFRVMTEIGFSRFAAALSLGLLGLSPDYQRMASGIGDDMVPACLAAVAMGLFIKLLRADHAKHALVTGLVLGVAYLFRYYYLAFPAFFALYVLVFDTARLRVKLKTILLMLLGFFVAVSPLGICHLSAGRSFLYQHTHGVYAFNILDQTNSWVEFLEYPKRYGSLFSVVALNPVAALKYFAKNSVHFFSEYLLQYFWVVGALAAAGLLLFVNTLKDQRARFFVAWVVALNLVSILATSPLAFRYMVILSPFITGAFVLTIYADRFPARLRDLIPVRPGATESAGRINLRALVLGAAIAGLAALSAKQALAAVRALGNPVINVDYQTREVGTYLRSLAPEPEDRVASTVFSIAYYGGIHAIPLSSAVPIDPKLSDLSNIDWASRGVRYLAYVEKQSEYEYPNLRYLLDPADRRIPREFRLLKKWDAWPKVTLYEIQRNK